MLLGTEIVFGLNLLLNRNVVVRMWPKTGEPTLHLREDTEVDVTQSLFIIILIPKQLCSHGLLCEN